MPLNSSHQLGQTVGAKMRAARLAKKYTQHQLAQPDFSVSYISAIERGQIQPSLRALEILARRLDLSSTDLLPVRGESRVAVAPLRRTTLVGEERDLVLLEAQILLYQGDPEQAIELLLALSSQKSAEHPNSTICYLLGRAYLECGDLQKSEHFLTRASQQVRQETDPLYPSILSMQITLHVAMHNRNVEQAFQLCQEGLAWLEQEQACPSPGNEFALAQLSASLGQYYSQIGRPGRAKTMFQQALVALDGRAVSSLLLSTYEHAAEFYQGKGEYPLASLYKYRSLLLAFQARISGLSTSIQHDLGRALLKSQPEEAYTYLQGAFKESEARHDDLAQASASVHLASWFMALGELKQAYSYACGAWSLAEPFGETLIGATALFLQGELTYKQQEYSSGDRLFKRGLAILEVLDEEEELVERLAHYARLLEARGQIQQAILYWKRAYERGQKHWAASQ